MIFCNKIKTRWISKYFVWAARNPVTRFSNFIEYSEGKCFMENTQSRNFEQLQFSDSYFRFSSPTVIFLLISLASYFTYPSRIFDKVTSAGALVYSLWINATVDGTFCLPYEFWELWIVCENKTSMTKQKYCHSQKSISVIWQTSYLSSTETAEL